MKALSVRQPYAWAIIHGGKNIENRGWSTPYRGPLLIHAGSKLHKDAIRLGMSAEAQEAPRGGYVGVVDLIDVLPNGGLAATRWADYRAAYWWVLANPRPLRDRGGRQVFVRASGRQGLFESMISLDSTSAFATPIIAVRN